MYLVGVLMAGLKGFSFNYFLRCPRTRNTYVAFLPVLVPSQNSRMGIETAATAAATTRTSKFDFVVLLHFVSKPPSDATVVFRQLIGTSSSFWQTIWFENRFL